MVYRSQKKITIMMNSFKITTETKDKGISGKEDIIQTQVLSTQNPLSETTDIQKLFADLETAITSTASTGSMVGQVEQAEMMDLMELVDLPVQVAKRNGHRHQREVASTEGLQLRVEMMMDLLIVDIMAMVKDLAVDSQDLAVEAQEHQSHLEDLDQETMIVKLKCHLSALRAKL